MDSRLIFLPFRELSAFDALVKSERILGYIRG